MPELQEKKIKSENISRCYMSNWRKDFSRKKIAKKKLKINSQERKNVVYGKLLGKVNIMI